MPFEQSELLRGLSEEEARRVTGLGARIRLASGAELFPLGGPADMLYIVERGRIAEGRTRLKRKSPRGRDRSEILADQVELDTGQAREELTGARRIERGDARKDQNSDASFFAVHDGDLSRSFHQRRAMTRGMRVTFQGLRPLRSSA